MGPVNKTELDSPGLVSAALTAAADLFSRVVTLWNLTQVGLFATQRNSFLFPFSRRCFLSLSHRSGIKNKGRYGGVWLRCSFLSCRRMFYCLLNPNEGLCVYVCLLRRGLRGVWSVALLTDCTLKDDSSCGDLASPSVTLSCRDTVRADTEQDVYENRRLREKKKKETRGEKTCQIHCVFPLWKHIDLTDDSGFNGVEQCEKFPVCNKQQGASCMIHLSLSCAQLLLCLSCHYFAVFSFWPAQLTFVTTVKDMTVLLLFVFVWQPKYAKTSHPMLHKHHWSLEPLSTEEQIF